MKERGRQLTLQERWMLDIESYKKGAKVLTASPQCMSCIHFVQSDAWHCKKYVNEEKPHDTRFIEKECPRYEDREPISVKVSDRTESMFYGGLFGFCVGDMLGVPVEFSARSERKKDPVREMRAYGTYHQHFGTWSDDTSLTLCLIDAVNRGYSIEKVADNFVAYYEKGQFTPHGEVFDIGNSTKTAIEKMSNGANPVECGGVHDSDNGNGSLMRILPLVFYGQRTEEDALIKMIEDISSLTHRHKRSKLACIIYVIFAMQLLSGADKKQALDRAVQFVDDQCSTAYIDELGNYARILKEEIISLPEDVIRSTGYVVDTLEAVIWCFFRTESYKEAVLQAINLGGDTDTIAAIVGGIAGIYYGFQSIPNQWVQSLAKKTELYQMFEQFAKIVL